MRHGFEQYFAMTYSGWAMEDLVVFGEEGKVLLFACRTCAALVKDPEDHVRWHRGEQP